MSEFAVRGHLCDGLLEYQEWGSRAVCIPMFNEQGWTSGCDDTNEIVIVFCPFCGEHLPPITPDSGYASWRSEDLAEWRAARAKQGGAA